MQVEMPRSMRVYAVMNDGEVLGEAAVGLVLGGHGGYMDDLTVIRVTDGEGLPYDAIDADVLLYLGYPELVDGSAALRLADEYEIQHECDDSFPTGAEATRLAERTVRRALELDARLGD